MGKRFSELETPNGHLVGEAASALQKSIRRGKEEDALYWASWIIASQDVGPADTMVAVQVRCLNENLLEQRKAEKDVPPTSSTSDGSKFAAQFWPRQTPQQTQQRTRSRMQRRYTGPASRESGRARCATVTAAARCEELS